MDIYIHNKILANLKAAELITTSQTLKLQTPNNISEIVAVFENVNIDSAELLKIIAKISNMPIYEAQASDIIKKHNNCFIVNNEVLCITNPFDEQIKLLMLSLKQKKELNFNVVKLCQYDDINIVPNTSSLKIENKINDNVIEQLWQKILAITIKYTASDIHFMPESKATIIAFRIYGQLRYNQIENLSNDIYIRLLNLILSKAGFNHHSFINLNAGEFSENQLRFRLQTIPTNYICDGIIIANATIRIHHHYEKVLELNNLGLDYDNVARLKEIATNTTGITFITGPTGSGKTTLLYAILREIQNILPNYSIRTIEDPIEIDLARINQAQVNDNIGLTFESAIKAFLRSDPDIALVGEIRSKEAAKHSIELALTGHSVLTTLHTKNALSVITRLVNSFDIDRVTLSETLSALIAIRMLQKVCTSCAKKDILANYFDKSRLQKYNNLGISNAVVFHENKKGCAECYEGYQGVVPILEIFTLNKRALQMIIDKRSVNEIQSYINNTADDKDNQSLWQSALNALLSGKTTITEIEYRLPTYDDNDNIVIKEELEKGIVA